MKVLALVRHATSTWTGVRYAGRSDPPLASAGRREAEVLAHRVVDSQLLADPSSVIISSPLRRALDTARVVADVVDRPLEVCSDWLEADLGVVDGLTFGEVEAIWPHGAQRLAGGDPAVDWPDGESCEALASRAARAVSHAAAHPGPVFVVSHGLMLRAALAAAAGTEAGNTAGVLRPCAVVVLRAIDGRWRLDPATDPEAAP